MAVVILKIELVILKVASEDHDVWFNKSIKEERRIKRKGLWGF